MLLQELQETSPPRDDGVPVEVRMAAVVMGFDLLHVNGLPYAHHLVQILAIPEQRRRVGHRPDVALEVDGVYLVKSNQRDEETEIGLSQGRTAQVPMLPQVSLDLVERYCKVIKGIVVRFLRHGEAAPVHAIVEGGIHPVADSIDF